MIDVKLSFLLIISVILFSCSSVDVSKISQEDLLNVAYEKESDELLNIFFDKWQAEIVPRDTIGLTQDEKTVYEIFNCIYNPMEPYFYSLNKQREMEYSGSPKKEDKTNLFFIVQNRINYLIADSLTNIFYLDTDSLGRRTGGRIVDKYKILGDTIKNFRPQLPFTKNTVYSNQKYENMLRKFLNVKDFDDAIKRGKFLRKVADIRLGDFPISYPYITEIQINTKRDKSLIRLSFGIDDLYALSIYNKGRWIKKEFLTQPFWGE
ncbi:MAG: hypothetical protein WC209_15670 [Ignavibacteriaceae bacterium]|jgi:hypothetical protein